MLRPNYGDRIGPTIRVGGHVRGGVAILPADATGTLTAVSQSRAYVASGLTSLMGQAGALAAKIKAGDLAAARAAWLSAHLTYERLGSAYGMFGDYDDEIDGLPDGLPRGVNDSGFAGFYRLEYGLWHGQSAAELTGPADRLDRDVSSLEAAFPGMALIPALALGDIALRTHEIMEHALRFQIGLAGCGGADGCAARLVGAEQSVADRANQAGTHCRLVGLWSAQSHPQSATVSARSAVALPFALLAMTKTW
jgi:high-affinity iron transporter